MAVPPLQIIGAVTAALDKVNKPGWNISKVPDIGPVLFESVTEYGSVVPAITLLNMPVELDCPLKLNVYGIIPPAASIVTVEVPPLQRIGVLPIMAVIIFAVTVLLVAGILLLSGSVALANAKFEIIPVFISD